MTFKSLARPRTRLADQVYEQILEAIRTGAITANQKIVQEKLAERFEISRTPVREALFRMEQEGILAFAGGGGFVIRQLGPHEIAEIYDARAAVEGFAARLLAERNDPATNDALRAKIREAESLDETSVQAYFEANRSIHRAIIEASRNRFLLEHFDNLWNRGSSFTLFASITDERLKKSLGNHLSLIDAIESGNGSVAAEAMIAHIREGHDLHRGGRPG